MTDVNCAHVHELCDLEYCGKIAVKMVWKTGAWLCKAHYEMYRRRRSAGKQTFLREFT